MLHAVTPLYLFCDTNTICLTESMLNYVSFKVRVLNFFKVGTIIVHK